jgi:hypothetical protein
MSSSNLGTINRRTVVQVSLGKSMRSYLKNNLEQKKKKKIASVAQVVEPLPTKLASTKL